MELSEHQWAVIDAMANRHEVVVHDPIERCLKEGTAVYVAGVNWTGDSTPVIGEEIIIWPSGIEEAVPR